MTTNCWLSQVSGRLTVWPPLLPCCYCCRCCRCCRGCHGYFSCCCYCRCLGWDRGPGHPHSQAIPGAQYTRICSPQKRAKPCMLMLRRCMLARPSRASPAHCPAHHQMAGSHVSTLHIGDVQLAVQKHTYVRTHIC